MKDAVLRAFGQDIWISEGPVVTAALGFHYPTRMAIIRLADGGLFVWSPVALDAVLQAQVDALGPVRHIVAPNHLHHVFVGDWQAAYPEAAFHAAPDLRAKRSDLRIDHDLGPAPHPAWANQIDQVTVTGNAITTEVVFFHRQSSTAIFADLLQQLPHGWYRGWRAIIARLDGMQGSEPAVPRKFRLAFRDKVAARAAVAVIKSWPAEKLIIAHGAPLENESKAVIDRAFQWLGG